MILDTAKMKDCVDAGLIMDISDLIKDKKNLAKYQPAIDSFKIFAGTDKTYGIRTSASQESPTKPAFVGTEPFLGSDMRWDYYVELGKPKMENIQDMLDVLKKMQAAHPTTESGKKTYAFSLYKDLGWGVPVSCSKNC